MHETVFALKNFEDSKASACLVLGRSSVYVFPLFGISNSNSCVCFSRATEFTWFTASPTAIDERLHGAVGSMTSIYFVHAMSVRFRGVECMVKALIHA